MSMSYLIYLLLWLIVGWVGFILGQVTNIYFFT